MATNYTGFDTEDNPFEIDPPEGVALDSPELYEYLLRQAALLREGYTAQQFEIRTIDESEIELLHATAVYALGTVTQFNHTVYGMMKARFVKFTNMAATGFTFDNGDFTFDSTIWSFDDGAITRGPVGLVSENWEVSNVVNRSSSALVEGLVAAIEIPISGQYGWVIIDGVNVNPVRLTTDETVTLGDQLTWTASGELSGSLDGGVIGRYVGSTDGTGMLAAGTVRVKQESVTVRSELNQLAATDTALQVQITGNATAILNLQNTVEASADYTTRMTAAETAITGLTNDLGLEITSRSNGDAILAETITALESSTAINIAAAVATETGERESADNAIIALVDGLATTHASDDTAINLVTAGLDSRVQSLENAGSLIIGQDVQAWSAALDLAAQGIFGEPGLEGSGVTIHGVNYDASLKVSDIGNSHPAEMILHRHSTTLPNALVTARSHSNDDTHSIVLDDDILFGIYAAGHDGVDYEIAGSITVEVDGTPGSDDMPGRIRLSVTPNGGFVPETAALIEQDKKMTLLGDLIVSGAGQSSIGGTGTQYSTGSKLHVNAESSGDVRNVTLSRTGQTVEFSTLINAGRLYIQGKTGGTETNLFNISPTAAVFDLPVSTTDTTDSTSTATGSIVTAGGGGFAKIVHAQGFNGSGQEIGFLIDRNSVLGNAYSELDTPANRRAEVRIRHANSIVAVFGATDSDEGTSGRPFIGYNSGVANYLLRFESDNYATFRAGLYLGGHLIMDKASTGGIKVDTVSPTFGWADLLGDQFSKNTGATKPVLTAYNGAINCWQFGAGDEAYITYHIPHDYVKGSEIFLHIHWSHTSTTVTGGSVTFKATSIYSKGHDQAAFQSTPAVGTFVGDASTTQYQQIITETSYSASTPTGIKLDTDLLEPDGVIELTLELDANNITSSAAVPDPFIHFIDVHYQTTGLIGTKDKAPDFY